MPRTLRIAIRHLGSSRGILIPKLMLARLGLLDQADLSIENGALVIRKPTLPSRTGWADAAKVIALANDDKLLLGEFSNKDDKDVAR